jgi:hypothetical protein
MASPKAERAAAELARGPLECVHLGRLNGFEATLYRRDTSTVALHVSELRMTGLVLVKAYRALGKERA